MKGRRLEFQMIENKISRFRSSEVELEYLLTGEDNNEVIMFVHGAGMNLRQYLVQHEYFSKEFNVLSVSLRGHGKSSTPLNNKSEQFRLEKHRVDLLELLSYLNIQQVHYVGNSAGGIIGYEIIKSQPNVIKSLCTFGTTAELKYPSIVASCIVGINQVMFKISPERYSKFLARNTSKISSVQNEVSHQFMLSKDNVCYFQNNLGNYSYVDVIEKLKIPYLLVQGEWDRDINNNLKTTIQAIKKNKNASLVKLDSAGHIANLDNTEEFNKILENFITGIFGKD